MCSTRSAMLENLGERIRALRTLSFLTLDGLASLADVSAADLKDLEDGGLYDPTIDEVSAIADALGVPMTYLIAERRGDLDLGAAARPLLVLR